jgi:hypothetical protein
MLISIKKSVVFFVFFPFVAFSQNNIGELRRADEKAMKEGGSISDYYGEYERELSAKDNPMTKPVKEIFEKVIKRTLPGGRIIFELLKPSEISPCSERGMCPEAEVFLTPEFKKQQEELKKQWEKQESERLRREHEARERAQRIAVEQKRKEERQRAYREQIENHIRY